MAAQVLTAVFSSKFTPKAVHSTCKDLLDGSSQSDPESGGDGCSRIEDAIARIADANARRVTAPLNGIDGISVGALPLPSPRENPGPQSAFSIFQNTTRMSASRQQNPSRRHSHRYGYVRYLSAMPK
mmetsp:Transcript_2689/g.6143  ORF Transcript_2689/g.6143 Transcript_2689/m.6143 type:complete len:127 (+) Transcript_2689:3245-3625(+)